jgi:hypothetical protein
MPGGDGTGPGGLGPMTGRGLGFCAGYNTPGYTKGPGMGMAWGGGRGRGARGFGRGMAWGRGRGFGYRAYRPAVGTSAYQPITAAPVSEDQQLNMLKQEKDFLESELNGIKNAIEDISKRINDLEQE